MNVKNKIYHVLMEVHVRIQMVIMNVIVPQLAGKERIVQLVSASFYNSD